MSKDEIEYEDHIKELVKKTSIPLSDIFQIVEGSPFELQLRNSFKFYFEELKRNIGFDLEPSFVFITSYKDINAFAKSENGVNVIGINIGTISRLYEIFINNPDLIGTLKSRFLKFPANDVMFETSMHFTFYHELGHLVQKASLLVNRLTENVGDKFSLRRHVYEFDADEFSSILIAGHVAQFSLTHLGKNLIQKDLEDILIAISTSILFYLLSFNSSQNELYYEECTHPHPMIRLVNIEFVVISHCLSTLRTHGVDINIDPEKIVIETMKLAELINDDIFDENRLGSMRSAIKLNMKEINDYIEFLGDQKRGDKEMSTEKWNIYAKEILSSKNMES